MTTNYVKVSTNAKLGKMGSFNIPAIKTCPYATELCKSVCYATKNCYVFKNVIASNEKNYQFSLTQEFVDTVDTEIKRKKLPMVRVHASGDFYTPEYAQKWVTIARRNPTTTFYAYTRTWTGKEFHSALAQLQALPNFTVLASVDAENKEKIELMPECLAHRITYMSMADEVAPIASYIVFRVAYKKKAKEGIVVKNLNGQVCPKETGLQSEAIKALSCAKCKLCFK